MIGHQHQWYGAISYAQHGDDMAVLNIFKRVGIEKSTYIDIGANHPYELSNTALLNMRGWRGVCVDANPDFVHLFSDLRPHDKLVVAAVMGSAEPNQMVEFYRQSNMSGLNSTIKENLNSKLMDTVSVPAMTLPQIVEDQCAGRWPDFLSIDAEGQDLAILHSIPPAASAVILIEALSQHSDDTDAIRRLARERGYFVHSWCGNNMLLVQNAWRSGLC